MFWIKKDNGGDLIQFIPKSQNLTIFISDVKYRELIEKCILNKGSQFEYTTFTHNGEIEWEEEDYGLFGSKFENHNKKKYEEARVYFNDFSKIPGVKAYEDTTLVKKQGIYKRYKSKFWIEVSSDFSADIYGKYQNNTAVFIGTQPEIEKALAFKNSVLANHRNILEQMYSKGALTVDEISLDYVGRKSVDLGEIGISFSSMQMQPLKSIEQALGIAMALYDTYHNEIPKNSLRTIGIFTDIVRIHKVEFPIRQNPNLKEW